MNPLTKNPVRHGDRTPARHGGSALAAVLLAAILLAAVLVGGVLVLGNLAPTVVIAMALTTLFFVVVAGVVAIIVLRRRWLLVPLAATYLVVSAAAGVLLGLPLVRDNVVAEDVVRVAAPTPSASVSAPAAPSPARPIALASGTFAERAHPGEGVATLVDTGDGRTVLTFTEFATDNGPDLFVYLVPAAAPAGTVDGAVNLGRLEGNIGNQQYDVPDGVDAGSGWRAVVWCRSFTVIFTEAVLA